MKYIVTILVTLSGSIAIAQTPAEKLEFFESKIRPVLVQSCYKCHNSIDKAEGDLALDYRDALLAGGESGEVIEPGKPGDSILIWALRHEEDFKMPVKAPKLTEAIIRDFEKWIKMGAPDPRLTKPTKKDRDAGTDWNQIRDQRQTWWSFQPLRRHAAPAAKDAQWNGNAIDQFVYNRMRSQELSPQDLAAPEVLVRRLHLILTGLPPKAEVVQAFVADPSPQAYEKIVDQLLASKQYGERWARHWMDWYRYAESHGSEGDPRIANASQYRDYLIRALNADVSYDQLLREHLAGDLMKSPRVNRDLGINESAIGPAHFRFVPHGFGVTDAYDEQITFTDNQIDVVSKAMLGLTVSCARCHDHKFDPISQKDFYRFYGVMVSNRASCVLIDSKEKLETNKALIADVKQDVRKEFAEYWLSEIDQLPERLQASPIFNGGKDTRKTNETIHPLGAWAKLNSAKLADFAKLIEQQTLELQRIKDGNKKAKAKAEFYADLRDQATFDKWYSSGNSSIGPKVNQAGSFALQTDGSDAIRDILPAGIYSHLISTKHSAVLCSGNFFAKGPRAMIRVIGEGAQLRVPIRNYPLTHGGLHPVVGLKLPKFSWQNATRKWTYWQDEQVHFELRTSMDIIPNPGNAERSWFGITEVIAGNEMPKEEGASLLDLVKDPSTIKDRQSLLATYSQTLRDTVTHWRDGKISNQEAEFLNEFVQLGFLTNQTDRLPAALQQLVATYREMEKAIPVPTRVPGLLEAEPFDQPLLVQGNYKQESKAIKRQFLEIFSNKPYSSHNSGRLELAEDMVSSVNTLKTRLLVNRLWAYVFNRGIVSSTDNFGSLGKEPTHPELLDALALDFEKNGWSIKQALRKMVTSRTFKSASQASPETRKKDPQNIYLSYFSPRRLDAEAILDSVNFIAGKPERAVYMQVRRNGLNPFLAAFNAPIPTSTVSFRNNTNVPTQSLAMMNGREVQYASQAWSKRLRGETPTDKINMMFIQIFSRVASAEELKLCLARLGENPNPDAYRRIAHALLNTKEFIYVH